MMKRVLLLLLIVATLIGVIAYDQYRPQRLKVSGFVEADEIRLGSRVGGRVARVLVAEGQDVKVGDVLVELEPYDIRERQREAEATLVARQAELSRLEAGFRAEEQAQAKAHHDYLKARLTRLENGPREQEIEATRAQRTVAESRLSLAQHNHRRVLDLFGKDAATQEEMDRATDELQAAQATLIVRAQELSLMEAGTRREELEEARAQLEEARQAWELAKSGFRREEIRAAQAARDAAQAAVDALRVQADELRITAPVDGVIEALDLQPGDLTPPGAAVLSMIDDQRLWVRAYVPENQLHLELGQSLQVTVDSYPDRDFAGRITYIARQAEFTPSNVQTPEERSKQVFRIKVTLNEGRDVLRPGMTADVWLEPAYE